MDVTSKTEGRALADAHGLPMQVKYDDQGTAIGQEIRTNLQVRMRTHTHARTCQHAIQPDPQEPADLQRARCQSCMAAVEAARASARLAAFGGMPSSGRPLRA